MKIIKYKSGTIATFNFAQVEKNFNFFRKFLDLAVSDNQWYAIDIYNIKIKIAKIF